MANQEHVAALKQGTAAWRLWWEENHGTAPDLTGASLAGVRLNRADLSKANFSGASLAFACFKMADLREANFSGAALEAVDFGGANLEGACLSNANLQGANLQGANLSRANLTGAYMRGADLAGANLRRANLRGTDLRGAVFDARTRWPWFFNADARGCFQRDMTYEVAAAAADGTGDELAPAVEPGR